jgi:hypothetical protein
MSAALPSLPPELLDHITGFMPNRAHLSNLSRTCRTLHTKTRKQLYESYRNIHLVWEGNASTVKKHEAGTIRTTKSPRIDCLLRTILENPELAEQITSVSFQSIGFGHESYAPRPILLERLPAHDIESIVSLIRGTTMSADNWRYGLENDDPNASIALLLWACPNLTDLDIGVDFIRANLYLQGVLWMLPDSMIPPHFGSTRAICNIRSVALGTREDHDADRATAHESNWRLRHPLSWRCFLPFLLHSPLQVATMNMLASITTDALDDMDKLPVCETLKTLRLLDASATPEGVGNLLACTPNLTKLEYEYCMPYDAHLRRQHLGETLGHVKKKLEHFRFYVYIMGPSENIDNYVIGQCPLQDFPVLSTLHISPHILLSWFPPEAQSLGDALPKHLKALCLNGDFAIAESNEWMGPELIQIASDFIEGGEWRAYTPELKAFYVENLKEDEWLEPDEVTTLRELCERNGLVYEDRTGF